jgi:hypothetical protein
VALWILSHFDFDGNGQSWIRQAHFSDANGKADSKEIPNYFIAGGAYRIFDLGEFSDHMRIEPFFQIHYIDIRIGTCIWNSADETICAFAKLR